MITPERIQELKMLCENATEGPWQESQSGLYENRVADLDTTFIYSEVRVEIDNQENNAALIAAARTAVPELIAEVERLQEFEWKYKELCK